MRREGQTVSGGEPIAILIELGSERLIGGTGVLYEYQGHSVTESKQWRVSCQRCIHSRIWIFQDTSTLVLVPI